MYVKVAPSHTPQFTLYPTVGPVQFGRHWSAQHPNDQRSYSDELNVSIHEIRLNGIVETPSNEDESVDAWGDPTWQYSYAWWTDENGAVQAVVTSGTLYLLGDNGKTIDKA